MKIKVKGLVFVGAAAIILSAGAANAAKTARSSDASGVVTSQKYSDEKYEYWSDKVDGTVTGQNLVTAATNEDKYPSMAAMKAYTNPSTANNGELVTYNPTGLLGSTHIVTDGESKAASGSAGYATSWANPAYDGSDTKVPSEAAVISAINAVETSINQNEVNGSTYITATPEDGNAGTTVAIDPTKIQTLNTDANNVDTADHGAFLTTAATTQRKQTENKYQVSKNHVWTDLREGISVNDTYLKETENTTDGSTEIAIDADKLVTTAAGVTSVNGAKLVTASAVQKKTGATEKMMVANPNGAWTSISNAVLDGTYVDVSGVDANGAVTLDVASSKITTTGAQLAASQAVGDNLNGDETDLVTAKAVKEYVASTGLGGELAAMPATCRDANAHCALVSSYDSTAQKVTLTWTPMAQ